jgi:hypothetical protein
MTLTIQTQDRVFHTEEIISLLTKYNMLSRFVCESIIDQAIESIELTPEEITQECWNLAKQYSDGFEAQTGGLIGPVGIDTLPPPLAKRLLAGQSGQLFMPFRWDQWFIVSRIEKIIPARLDLQMYQRLRNEFFHNWLQKQFQQHAYQIAHLEESFKSHEVVILNDRHLSLASDRQNQKYAHHG